MNATDVINYLRQSGSWTDTYTYVLANDPQALAIENALNNEKYIAIKSSGSSAWDVYQQTISKLSTIPKATAFYVGSTEQDPYQPNNNMFLILAVALIGLIMLKK